MTIDNIDLTQQLFSFSIFTDFRYQSIKITFRLLPIFIDWLHCGVFRYSSTTIWTIQNGLTEELRSATRKNEFISLHWLTNSLRHRLESWRFEKKTKQCQLVQQIVFAMFLSRRRQANQLCSSRKEPATKYEMNIWRARITNVVVSLWQTNYYVIANWSKFA